MIAGEVMVSANKIPIYLRIKPKINNSSLINKKRPSDDQDFEIDFEKNIFEIPKHESRCFFSKAFDNSVKNNDLFKRIGANLVKNVLQGNDSTIFTLGPSNLGKSFSMLGDIRNPGILVQSIKYILESIKNQDKECDEHDIQLAKHYFGPLLFVAAKPDNKIQNSCGENKKYGVCKGKIQKKYFISLNIFELFDDQIFDLLSPHSTNNRNSEVISKDMLQNKYKPRDLTSRYVNDLDEAHYVTFKAIQKRHIENTAYNQVSSKGHIFIYINLHELSVMGYKNKVEINTARLTVCDLAGAEKYLGQTNEPKQDVKRYDTHTTQLGKVIAQLFDSNVGIVKKKALINSSKLTRLLFADYVGNKDHLMSILVTFDPENPNLNLMSQIFDILKSKKGYPNFTKSIKNKDLDLNDTTKGKNDYGSNDAKQRILLETIENLKKKLDEKDEEIAMMEYRLRYETSLEYQKIIKKMEDSNMVIQRKIDEEGIDFTDKKLKMLQTDMNLEIVNLKKDLMRANKDMIEEYEILLKQKGDENKKLLKETKLLKRKLKELEIGKSNNENSLIVNEMESGSFKKSKLSLETSIKIVPDMFKPVKHI